MQKLIAQLRRLYLLEDGVPPEVLKQHLSGETTVPVSLVAANGTTRAIVIPFDKLTEGDEAQHWTVLCTVANALQSELNLPAPAVSISGAQGYRLWLSLAASVPTAVVQQFMQSLHQAYFPTMALAADAALAPVELPPCLHHETGRWAAFINPGLGASFAEESGLEMAPPFAGQTALLDGLKSISEAQLLHAMTLLQRPHDAAPIDSAPAPVPAQPAPGLLLKDATLEEIVQHLHARNIEPTFRHLIRTR